MLKRRALVVVAALVLAAGCRDVFKAHADVVAYAGDEELTVTRLAEIVASASDLPLQPDVIELLARRWVEYSYLGKRAAAGDGLADSVTIVTAMWPDVRAAVVDSFRTIRLDGLVDVTPAQVDSAFRVGDVRFLAQILKSAGAETPPTERDSLRQLLTVALDRIVAGGSWEEANALNDDENSREQNGALGLIGRGQTTPRFENAAFALGPGEISQVVETEFGFHLIYRPELEDIREAFTEGVRQMFEFRLDSIYEIDLVDRRQLEVRSNAPSAVREAAASPLQAKGSQRTLATYDGGRFAVGDLIRWLQYLPAQVHQQIPTAPDQQLMEMVRSLTVRELAWLDAGAAGAALSPERYLQIASLYGAQLGQIQLITGLQPDTLATLATSLTGREEAASVLVDRYIEIAANDARLFLPLPPFLADQLLADGNWDVSVAGIQMALQRATQIRGAAGVSTMNPGGVQ